MRLHYKWNPFLSTDISMVSIRGNASIVLVHAGISPFPKFEKKGSCKKVKVCVEPLLNLVLVKAYRQTHQTHQHTTNPKPCQTQGRRARRLVSSFKIE